MNSHTEHLHGKTKRALALSHTNIRRLVRADIDEAQRSPTALPMGAARIKHIALAVPAAFPYWRLHFWTSIALASLCLGLFVWLYLAGPFTWSAQLAAVSLLAGAAVGLHSAFAKPLPGHIEATQPTRARERLEKSGDSYVKPVSVLHSMGIAAVLLIDGFLSGMSLATTAFAASFTPKMAMMASMLWSAGLAFLLWKLCSMAAMETCTNERRHQLRCLLASADAADRERGHAMKSLVGGALQHDYSEGANRYRARTTLVVVTLMLTAITFAMRLLA